MFGFKEETEILKFGIWNNEQLNRWFKKLILVNAVKQSRRQEGKQIQDPISSVETGLEEIYLYIGITSCDYKVTYP